MHMHMRMHIPDKAGGAHVIPLYVAAGSRLDEAVKSVKIGGHSGVALLAGLVDHPKQHPVDLSVPLPSGLLAPARLSLTPPLASCCS